MNFECENCHFKLTNEFCPKCGQRMDVACDQCPGKDQQIEGMGRQITELEWRVRDLSGKLSASVGKIEHRKEIEDLRERYEKTIDDQLRELMDLRQERNAWANERAELGGRLDKIEEKAWRQVADALGVKLTTGYRFDEARVLQQLEIERSAAGMLRAEVAQLKIRLAAGVDEFARQREEFMEHLQNKNGAARIESAKTEV